MLNPSPFPLSDQRLSDPRYFKPTTAYFYNDIEFPSDVENSGIEDGLRAKLDILRDHLQLELVDQFNQNGANTRQISINEQIPSDETGHHHTPILRFIYLGDLHPEIVRSIESGNVDSIREAFREYLPQLNLAGGDRFYIGEAKRQFNTHGLPPNYLNVLLIRDERQILSRIPKWLREEIANANKARLGHTRDLTVPFQTDSEGNLTADRVFFNTLEGGSPILPVTEAAARIHAIASVDHVSPPSTVHPSLSIPLEHWRQVPQVQAIIRLCNLLGHPDVNGLSPRIEVQNLLREGEASNINRILIRRLWSASEGMGEGAVFGMIHRHMIAAFPAEIRKTFYDLLDSLPDPFTGKYLPFISGTSGANVLKTDLKPQDLVPGFPTRDGKIFLIPFDRVGNKVTPWSVEGPEYCHAMMSLSEEELSKIYGALHTHRVIRIQDNAREIATSILCLPNYHKYDINEDPPYPCSSAGMFEQTDQHLYEVARIASMNLGSLLVNWYIANHGSHSAFVADPVKVVQVIEPWLLDRKVIFEKDFPQY